MAIEITVSDVDGDLQLYPWFRHKTTGYFYGWYYTRRPSRHLFALHQVVLERKLGRRLRPGEHPDHIDRNKANNRRRNLRLCVRSHNQANAARRRDNTSGFKGVNWHKKLGFWRTRIQVTGEEVFIGLFTSVREAALAYDDAARLFYGEFARVNFPRKGERGCR